jgi:alpha-galactosidase
MFSISILKSNVCFLLLLLKSFTKKLGEKIMKHLTILLLLLLSVTIMASDFPVEPYSSKPLESELTFVNQWKNFLLQKGEADTSRYDAVIPFSFVCGDRSSREWIKPDTATITSGEWLPNRTRKHTLVWKENVTSFVCTMELTEFQDFPALEWLVRLHNAGQSDTPLIHDFNALHTRWDAPGVIMPILHRSIGSPGAEDDFFFQAEMMHNSLWDQKRRLVMDSPTNLHFAQTQRYCIPGDKRTSAVWMPFFNYQTGSDGLITALGWSGSWQAAFDHTGAGKSTISAGLENLNTKLLPDESIRSPLILVLYWQGELMHGQNVCRQFILAHHSPQIDGKLIEPPDVGIVWGGVPTAEHLEFIEGIKK